MANLTWRDVANPDISGAVQGYTAFSKLLGDSLDGLKSGVSAFDQVKSDAMNKQFSLALGQLPNAEALAQAAASGSIGGIDFRDPAAIRRLSQANLSAVGTDAIQSRAAKDIQFAATQRGDTEQKALDAQAPLIGELTALSYAPETPERNARIAELKSQINYSGLGANKAHALAAQSPSDANTALGYADTRLSLDNRVRDQKIEDIAYNIAARLKPTLPGVEYLDQALTNDPEIAKLDGRTQAAVRARLGSMFGGTSGSGGPAGAIAAAALGGPPTGLGTPMSIGAPQQEVATALKAGGLSDAVVAGFLGNFHIEGGYSGATGDGGTAGGIAQWRLERRDNFVKQFGKDPSQASAGEQAKFVLWELQNPEAAGMTKEQAAQIRAAKTPEEAADLIDRYYERSDGKARSARVSAAQRASDLIAGRLAQTGTANQNSQMHAYSFATDWAEAANDQSNLTEVADKLVEEFPGKESDRGKMLGYVRDIQARGRKVGVKISPAEAAAILRNSTTSENIAERLWFGEALGNGTKLDKRLIESNIDQVRTRSVEKVIVGTQTLQDASQKSSGALAQRQAAEARVTQLQTQMRTNPQIDPRYLEQAKAELAMADQLYRGYVNDQRSLAPPELGGPVQPTPAEALTAAAKPKPVAKTVPGKPVELMRGGRGQMTASDGKERRVVNGQRQVRNGRGVWVREI